MANAVPEVQEIPGQSLLGRSRFLRYLIVIGGLVITLALLAGLKVAQIQMLIGAGKAMQAAGPPPEAVGTTVAQKQTWESTLLATASVTSTKGVAVSNDAPGIVSRLSFESGKTVRQGDVLVELDSGVERAQLASTRARRDLAELTWKRSLKLASTGAVSQSEVDANQSAFKSLAADASALEAQIARKTIRAPFSGKLGIRLVNLGQYLPSGTTVAVLESHEPDYVDFTLPQQLVGKIGVGMKVRAFREGEEQKPIEGTISAIEPALDAATRNVKVRATLPVDSDVLRPGMFLRVHVVLPEQREVVAVPLTAIVHASYGDSVFVVQPAPNGAGKKIARQKFVRVGEARGDFVSVLQGLSAGEEVVSAGAFKLRNGAPVTVDNTVKPKSELAPTPDNR